MRTARKSINPHGPKSSWMGHETPTCACCKRVVQIVNGVLMWPCKCPAVTQRCGTTGKKVCHCPCTSCRPAGRGA